MKTIRRPCNEDNKDRKNKERWRTIVYYNRVSVDCPAIDKIYRCTDKIVSDHKDLIYKSII